MAPCPKCGSSRVALDGVCLNCDPRGKKRMAELFNDMDEKELFEKRKKQGVTDIDGNTYKTVIIGTQEWIAENLNVEHYRNGDIIPQVQDQNEWAYLKTGAWCYYDNDPENGKKYGKLYNWYAVNDPRGLAPEGWHIPNNDEWNELIKALGGEDVASGKLKSKECWKGPISEFQNMSGFSALPAGALARIGRFISLFETCYFWSISQGLDKMRDAYYLSLSNDKPESKLYCFNKKTFFSCRCVKD